MARPSAAAGDLVVVEVFGDDTCPAFIAAKLAATATRSAAVRTPRAGAPDHPWPRIEAASRSDNPYLATTRFTGPFDNPSKAERPSIVAFKDTVQVRSEAVAGIPNLMTLAVYEQTGTVFGLAHDAERGHVYAAAYQEVWGWFPNGQAGAIYRVDLAADTVVPWATLHAGPELAWPPGDPELSPAVGRTSLGDIESDDAGRFMFVVNLFDRRIHRLALPDGQPLGSFEHGAAREPWAANARPFGLGWYAGWLYHGVVDSREDAGLPGALSAHVYRTRYDGTELSEVASVALDYERMPRWTRWEDGVTPSRWNEEGIAQPMLTDIDFRPNGDLILGLRDRLGDAIGVYKGKPNGDILPTMADGPGRWTVVTAPEHFDDEYAFVDPWSQRADSCEECAYGTLASLPRHDAVVTSMMVYGSTAAIWFDAHTGKQKGPVDGNEVLSIEDFYGGDLEALVQRGGMVYLPIAQRDLCDPRPRLPADITFVIDASTTMLQTIEGGERRLDVALSAVGRLVDGLSMSDDARSSGPRLLSHDQVGIVGFNDDAWIATDLTTHRPSVRAALDRLAEGARQGTRIDLGLQDGLAVAAGAWSRGLADRHVVLLTDGWLNGVPPAGDGRPETTVLDAGHALRAAGVSVLVVGVGWPDEVNRPLLVGLAGSTDAYYSAEDGAGLRSALAFVGQRFKCPPAP